MYQRFEWDPRKATINLQKHGVRFEVAAEVFQDPFAKTIMSGIENGEQRWQTFGRAGGRLLLLVAHTVREEDDGTEVIRIISARPLDRTERRRYEHG